jgi:S-adenosylmethionine synthetase
MRDFRDAKVMARALRDALKAKAIETTHSEALELIAKAFGYENWNILSAKIEAAGPPASDERSLSASRAPAPTNRGARPRDRHAERADRSKTQRGFHWEKASIEVYLHAQSADIAQGVDSAGNKDKGAGDQGIMFGYACRETPELMPAPIYYAHRILKVMSKARPSGETHALGPDAKSQVTIRYEAGKPVEATQIVVSTKHLDEKLSSHDIQAIVEPYVRQALPPGWISKHTVWHVNPTGKFVIGGPDGDCGLTGRKIIVDT